MKEYMDYITHRLNSNQKQFIKASEILEDLYFSYIKPVYKFVWMSEDYRIAKDLLYLKKAVSIGTFNPLRLRTQFIRNVISQYGIKAPLSIEDKQTIQNNIISEYSYYITAVFIADILNKHNRNEFWKWVATIILTTFAAFGSYGWLFGNLNP